MPPDERTRSSYELAVSPYDRAASLLVALLLFVGIVVLGLLIVFFTSRVFTRQKAVAVTMTQVAGRAENAAFGFSRDLEPPGVEQYPDLLQPQLQETLTALPQVVAEKLAQLDDRAIDAEMAAGAGRGAGDARQVGAQGEGLVEKIPRAERWEVRFEATSLDVYARQLDHFGIELATILAADNKVHYASHLAKARPDRRSADPAAEKRLYMTWRSGPLSAADRDLLARAGIPVGGGIMLQFYPAETENILAELERQRAGKRDVNEIRKTIFGVRQQDDTYAFYVIDQKYF